MCTKILLNFLQITYLAVFHYYDRIRKAHLFLARIWLDIRYIKLAVDVEVAQLTILKYDARAGLSQLRFLPMKTQQLN